MTINYPQVKLRSAQLNLPCYFGPISGSLNWVFLFVVSE